MLISENFSIGGMFWKWGDWPVLSRLRIARHAIANDSVGQQSCWITKKARLGVQMSTSWFMKKNNTKKEPLDANSVICNDHL